jgi:hypothetical protein
VVTRTERIIAGIVAGLCLLLLGTGASLDPDPKGHSTHEQLGLTPCPFLIATGKPCITCGMTTSVSLAARGQPIRSFLSQPFGALIALGAAVGFWGGLHVAAFGSRLGRVAEPLLRPRTLWVMAGLATLAWVYKIVTWTS